MRRYRARKKAEGLRNIGRWEPDGRGVDPGFLSSHRILDARSLAMHCLIARRIAADPALLDVARRNLNHWQALADGAAPRHLREWRQILAQPWPSIAALITEQSERAARLRQSSPFAGILTTAERRRVYEAFRA